MVAAQHHHQQHQQQQHQQRGRSSLDGVDGADDDADAERVPLVVVPLEIDAAAAAATPAAHATKTAATATNTTRARHDHDHDRPGHRRLQPSPETCAVALVYFVQGVLRLSSLAVSFFLKDDLGLGPSALALADTITAVPWSIKPLYGFVTDSFPIAGRRRQPWLVVAGLVGCGAWLALACAGARAGAGFALLCITAAAASTAFADVVADAVVVGLARGAPPSTEGALQSLCWAMHAAGRVLTAYLSGWLLEKLGATGVFAITAAFPLIICLASCMMREAPAAAPAPAMGAAAAGSSSSAAGDHGHHHHHHHHQYGSLIGRASSGLTGGDDEEHAAVVATGAQPLAAAASPRARERLAAAAMMVRRSASPSFSGDGAGGGKAAQPSSGGGGGGSFSSSGGGIGGGGGGCLAWWRAGAAGVARSARLLWAALRRPAVLRPAAFLFLWQAMPNADSAMFVYKTDKLGFSKEFFGRVKLVVALADLAGVALFNARLKHLRLRTLLVGGTLVGFLVGLTPLVLVLGLNRSLLGVSDHIYALCDSALLASVGQVLMMPTLVLAARLCPPGIEATLYAALMSVNNSAGAASTASGALLMRLFGVTAADMSRLPTLLLVCSVLSLLPLPLIRLVPNEAPAAAGGGV